MPVDQLKIEHCQISAMLNYQLDMEKCVYQAGASPILFSKAKYSHAVRLVHIYVFVHSMTIRNFKNISKLLEATNAKFRLATFGSLVIAPPVALLLRGNFVMKTEN